MSGEDDGSNLNRRTIMNAIGAAAGGSIVGGLGSVSVTATDGVSEDRVEQALGSERVQTVFDAVGEVPVDAESAESYEVSDRQRTYHVTQLQTPVGTLSYGTDDEGKAEATLTIGSPDEVGAAALSHLDDAYTTLPTGGEAAYIAGEGGDALHRSPTDAERDALAAAVGASPDEIFAFAYEDHPGFGVLVQDGDDELTGYSVHPAGVPETAGAVAYDEASPDAIRRGDVREYDWGLKKCGSVCLTCVAAVRTCLKCAVPCAGSPTGIGAIACAVCLVASCGGGAAACYLCVDNCKHHLP